VADNLNITIVGGSGYVGGELLRLLAGHPEVTEVRGYSSSNAGRRPGDNIYRSRERDVDEAGGLR